jgi:hypothetical protein
MGGQATRPTHRVEGAQNPLGFESVDPPELNSAYRQRECQVEVEELMVAVERSCQLDIVAVPAGPHHSLGKLLKANQIGGRTGRGRTHELPQLRIDLWSNHRPPRRDQGLTLVVSPLLGARAQPSGVIRADVGQPRNLAPGRPGGIPLPTHSGLEHRAFHSGIGKCEQRGRSESLEECKLGESLETRHLPFELHPV